MHDQHRMNGTGHWHSHIFQTFLIDVTWDDSDRVSRSSDNGSSSPMPNAASHRMASDDPMLMYETEEERKARLGPDAPQSVRSVMVSYFYRLYTCWNV